MNLQNKKSKRVLKAFLKMGLKKKKQSGTHVIVTGFLNGKKVTFPIPIHKKEIHPSVLTDIIKHQAGITKEEFLNYY